MYQQYKSRTTQGNCGAANGKKTNSQRAVVQATGAAMHAAEKAAKKSSRKRERAPKAQRLVVVESNGGHAVLDLRGLPREKPEDTLKRLNDVAAEKEKTTSTSEDTRNSPKAYKNLGDETAQSLPLPAMPRYFRQFPNMTTLDLDKFCEDNQLNRPNPANKVDILYHDPVGPPAKDDTRMPVVMLHKNNAWCCNHLVMGRHGFVWTFTPPDRQNFPKYMFHLFCRQEPVRTDWAGDEVYEYKGIYVAHRLDVTLPARIWRQLSEPARKLAGRIHYDYYPARERPEKVEDEVAKFEQGIHHAQLVVLEFVTVGSAGFSDALGSAYGTTLRALGRGKKP